MSLAVVRALQDGIFKYHGAKASRGNVLDVMNGIFTIRLVIAVVFLGVIDIWRAAVDD
jgi:hypothetical protein